jgi:type II secretory pathway pseudopilin PulG
MPMEPLCACARNPTSARKQASQSGIVLLAVLAVMIVLTIFLAAMFGLAAAELRRSKKQLEQDRGVAGMEAAVTADLRLNIRSQFSSNASLDIPSLSLGQARSGTPNEGSGYYAFSLSAQSPSGDTVPATQSRPSLFALEDSDDPFRGTLAIVDLLYITASANRIDQSPPQWGDPLSLGSHPVLAIRQIPLSQFSIYSSDDLELDGSLNPDTGRVYSLGNITVSGPVQTDFPLGAAANINLSGAGSSLQARSAPDSAPVTMQLSSTTDPDWPALAKSVDHSTILSGRDLPMGTISAASVAELTAPPGSPPQGQYKDSQRLYWQCARIITENAGVISVSANNGSALPDEGRQFSIYETTNYTAGPVVVFDYSKVAPGGTRTSFYFASTNPNAVLLIRNAAPQVNVSIVTPHQIMVAGGGNLTGSLITGSGVSSVPAGW